MILIMESKQEKLEKMKKLQKFHIRKKEVFVVEYNQKINKFIMFYIL